MEKNEKSFGRFLILWSGEFVSAIGSGLSSFGLGVFIFQQTGKVSDLAMVTLFAFMPSLLLSPLAGILADRHDRRILMVLGDSLSVLGLIFILACLYRGQVTLWQICMGVTISSVFSSLMEPAYKATISDLLTKEQYTKASGLVQVAGSAKYLISPIIAGVLLVHSDIQLLLLIDIFTFILTVFTTLFIRRSIVTVNVSRAESIIKDFTTGWQALSQRRGVLILVIIGSVLTFSLGFIQLLSNPLILSFADSSQLGVIETISTTGILAAGLILDMFSLKKDFVNLLTLSLFLAGIFMCLFGLRENLVLICVAGFLFFSMLPLANTSLDYLIRTNIENSVQGRVWGLIGVISQLGYVFAYTVSGFLADHVTTPLMLDNGQFAHSLGRIMGTGRGRGTGLLIIFAGILLSITSIVLFNLKSVRKLEVRG